MISSCGFISFPFLLTHSTLAMGPVVQGTLILPRLLLIFKKCPVPRIILIKYLMVCIFYYKIIDRILIFTLIC